MQSYINYLLGDIANAARGKLTDSKPLPANHGQKNIDDYFREIQRFLESYPQHPFSYYCGLNKEQFPPPNRLNDVQMESVCAAFRQMLATWNIAADIHIAVPISKMYSLLISVLDEKVNIAFEGLTTIEFCNYHPPSCAMGEYCTCKEYLEKDYPPDTEE